MTDKSLSNNTKIVRNTIALYIRMGITMIVSFITARVTLQLLGVNDYGLNNLVGGVVFMFSFITGSLGTAVQRFYSVEIGRNNERVLKNIFSTGLFLHLIISIFTLLLLEILAVFFIHKLNIPQDRMFAAQCVFQISAASLVLNILNVPYAALLRAREDFTKVAALDIINSLLRLIIVYLLFKINFDKLILFSMLNFGVSLIHLVSINIIAKKYKEVRFSIAIDKSIVKNMISFTSMMIFSVFADLFNKEGSKVLINIFFGLTINAAYAVSYQISSFIESFAMSFKQSIVPQLMSSYGGKDLFRMKRLIYTGTKITFLLIIIISFPIMFESAFLLKLWLGTPPLYAAEFTSLVMININISSFPYYLYQGIHATGKIKMQQILTSINSLLNLGLIFIGLKLGMNFYAVLYFTIISSFIFNLIVIYNSKRYLYLDIKEYLMKIAGKCMILVFILFFLLLSILYLLPEGTLRFLTIFTFTIFFVVLSGYFYLLNAYEKLFIMGKIMQGYRRISLKEKI